MVDEYSETVRANVRPGTRVARERREDLRLLDVSNLPRDPKAARESKSAKEARETERADEVEFFEKRWTKRSPETIQEIHAYVDGLRPGSPLPPTGGAPHAAPQARTRFGPDSRLTPFTSALEASAEERALLERHLGATAATATVVYRTPRSRVLRVEFERNGETHRTLATITGDRVSGLHEIQARVDARPAVATPSTEASKPAVAGAPPRSVVTAPPPPENAAPAEAAGQAIPAEPAPGKKRSRFGFLRRGKDKDSKS